LPAQVGITLVRHTAKRVSKIMDSLVGRRLMGFFLLFGWWFDSYKR
jgi:hypothetical protein